MAQDSAAMNESTKQAIESRALAPRFYTTNCQEIGPVSYTHLTLPTKA